MILIIDDDEGIRELLQAYLCSYSGEVHCASSVPEGLKLLQKNSYSVVVCDLILGSGHGGNIFNYMRKPKSPHCETPILFISGQENGPPNQDDYASFLSKPFGQEEFLQALKNLRNKVKESVGENSQGSKGTTLHPDLKKIIGGKG